MMNHRTALRKIFSTLKVLAKQGLPLRGINNDENSNFIQILKARAEDVSELESWLKRNGHKWLHHDVQNEILELMVAKVMSENLAEIRQAEFCALLLDETSDLSKIEQISICLRIVSQNLVSSEFFLGFYSTSSTKAETLFQIVQDVFLRFNLPLTKLRGQCYDGAANVSGKITGLQTRLREIEPRALYVHCNAHNLNLVVQDAMEGVPATRKFIGVVKDMINFVKDSPKRISQFQQLQSERESESESSTNKNFALAAYCPTRWVMRISSLKTVRANYESLMKFFMERITDCEVDSIVSAKASGYFEHMRTFEFFFFLTMIIELLDRIEILNKDLQNSELSVNDSYRKIEGVMYYINVSRDSKFEIIWQKSNDGVKELDIDEPQLPRQRKIPKRLDTSNTENLVFKTPKEMYRKIYFEIYDRVLTSLNNRFDTEAARFLKSLEAFAVGESTNVTEIINFYGDDFEKDRLISDRDMLLNLTSRSNVKVSNLREIVNFLRKNEWSMGLIPDYVKFIKLLMTIPGSSCTNERSFSVLRRLKNYLRTTMLQDRLNHVAILHIYNDITDKLDIEILMDEFIARNVKRTTVFALSKK
ncbi:zinc finger MYM-type protein 1-like [Camponotus floridanus]|nr:zinc finger MYM-type protein 1 [Camponotus floridanus]XP_025270767.1 zinc finger MYM-type protein 1-like [Camponotus floridanus]